LKYFIKSSRGTVSVYFIITLSALFLFNAVLIDFARIKIAEKQTEHAIRAALRSTLSQFDSSLQSYGLYALADADQGEDVFREIINQNLPDRTDDDEFRLIQMDWDEDAIQLQPSYSLADPVVFKQQVYEDMKYKAPIEFILEIVNKFQKSGMVTELKEASTFSKEAEGLEDLIVQREKSLDHAWNEAVKLIGPLGETTKFYHKYKQRLSDMNNLAQEITLIEIDQAEPLEQKDIKDEEDDLEENIAAVLLAKISEFVGLILITDHLLQQDYNQLQLLQIRIMDHLKQAKEYNGQLKAEINTSRLSNDVEAGSIEEMARSTRENIVVLERSHFEIYEVGIANILGLFSGFKLQFDPAMLVTGADFVQRYERLVTANEAYHDQAGVFYYKQKSLEDERKSRNEEIDSLKKDQIDKTEELLKKLKDLFADCGDDDEFSYLQLNTMENISPSVDLDDADEVGKQSMAIVDRLGLSLLNIRDKAYLNEYALTKFNYRTLDKNMPNEHKLLNQEVEYILYGMNSCILNHGAAYAEIFALRLATRTMEALMNPRGKMIAAGSPLLVFLWAVAEGAVKAYQDIKLLIDGKEVELSAKLSNAITINYKDYLRIFLFIHRSEGNTIARMQELIELNTGTILQHKFTYIEGHTASSIRLWFIPGIMKMMNYDVDGREAKISKTMILSY
jgi:hypothetical protein